MKNYSDFVKSVDLYPGALEHASDHEHQLFLAACGIANEAGELLGKLKKALRDNAFDKYQASFEYELGDILWYCQKFCNELNTTLAAVIKINQEKLAMRASHNTLRGEGDNR